MLALTSGRSKAGSAVPESPRAARNPGKSERLARPAPLLRVPPFPGAVARPLGSPSAAPSLRGDRIDEILKAVRALRVGGDYWAPQPELPEAAYTLVRVSDPAARGAELERLSSAGAVLCWTDRRDTSAHARAPHVQMVGGPCDAWHLLSRASAVVVDADDELALLAAIAGVPVRTIGAGIFVALESADAGSGALARLASDSIGAFDYSNPYTGEPIGPLEAVSLCGFWRGLIDSNRDLSAAVGFAFWKRPTLAPLLWGGSGDVPFASGAPAMAAGNKVAVWKSRTSESVLGDLEAADAQLVEVEDGFIRSAGLGADCVPPLSIAIDRLGVHFDPERTSELEQMLEGGTFSSELIERARQLRALIVASGLSKYESGPAKGSRPASGRRLILVPGQVEDDRAVVSGGQGLTSNFELLRRVRADSPDAYIVYKPHPDVEAGHRSGAIPDRQCLGVADEVVRGEPMSALLDSADEVHVNTSLAGFEALLREKPVTTHGIPFYAGWGLTRDLGPVPSRRTARRSLDELVAATLLLYPRYLDPVTGLPCPPEILVRRLAESSGRGSDGIVVRLRRLQGRCRRGLQAMRALVAK